jgi:hypothetical protein
VRSRVKSSPATNVSQLSEAEMRALLGDLYPRFRELLAEAEAAEWRQSRNSSWLLKVSERKRSLFYASPEMSHLRITVLLGERAVEAALAGRVSKALQESIRSAKAFPEGRPVTILVKRPSDLAAVEQLIAVKREAVGTRKTTKERPRRRRAPPKN